MYQNCYDTHKFPNLFCLYQSFTKSPDVILFMLLTKFME
jgi:hypothetical protein